MPVWERKSGPSVGAEQGLRNALETEILVLLAMSAKAPTTPVVKTIVKVAMAMCSSAA